MDYDKSIEENPQLKRWQVIPHLDQLTRVKSYNNLD